MNRLIDRSPFGPRLLLLCLAGALLCFSLATARLRGLILNSTLLSLGTLSISLPLGTLIAILVAKTSVGGRRVIQSMMIAMLFVPLIVQATAWKAALGPNGWLTTIEVLSRNLTGWAGAIWIHGASSIAWVVIFVSVALSNVPRELEEEALQDSHGAKVLLRVSMQSAWGGVIASALWICVICFGEITITDLFQVRTFAEEIYTAANLGLLTNPLAKSQVPLNLGVEVPEFAGYDLGIGLMILFLLVASFFAAVWSWLPVTRFISPSSGWLWQIRAGFWPLTFLAWILTLAIVGLPLGSLLQEAGQYSFQEENHLVSGWSLTRAIEMVAKSPWEHRREVFWSFAIGVSAAISATLLGILFAWGMRSRWLPTIPTAFLLALGFSIPGPLLGVWTIGLLNHPEDSFWGFLTWYYDRTILAPVLVQMLRALPLATLVLSTQFASVSQDVLDSAASEGARGWQQLTRIVLPARWQALCAAFCMALIIAMSDMAATLLVLPPGVSTLSTRIFGLLHYGAEDRVSALCVALALGLGSLAVIAYHLPRMLKNR